MPFTQFTKGKNYGIKPRQKVVVSDEYFNVKFRDMNRNHRLERMRQLLRDNYTLNEIAAVFGITYPALQSWIHANCIHEFPEFKEWKTSLQRKKERMKRDSTRKQPLAATNYMLRRIPVIEFPKSINPLAKTEYAIWANLANQANSLRNTIVRLLGEDISVGSNGLHTLAWVMDDWDKARTQAQLAWKTYKSAIYVRNKAKKAA